jgi:hypothetical protein
VGVTEAVDQDLVVERLGPLHVDEGRAAAWQEGGFMFAPGAGRVGGVGPGASSSSHTTRHSTVRPFAFPAMLTARAYARPYDARREWSDDGRHNVFPACLPHWRRCCCPLPPRRCACRACTPAATGRTCTAPCMVLVLVAHHEVRSCAPQL